MDYVFVYFSFAFDVPEQFSLECRKVIGFALLRYTFGLKNSRQFYIQSEVKPKPIVTRSYAFSRASRQLHVFTSSFGLSVSFVIGQMNYFTFSLVLRHSIESSTNLALAYPRHSFYDLL